MFKITKHSADRVDIDLSGSIDAEAMRRLLDELFQKSEGVSKGRMLYRITDFFLPTLGAIGVEFAHLPKLFGLLGKFDKCAVLTDTPWIGKAAEIEGALLPGLAIKSFGMADTAAAEAWLGAGA